MKIYFFLLFCFLFFINTFCQENKKTITKPYKVGFLYNNGSNEKSFFDDPDYTYTTNTYKAQVFYKLKNWRNFKLELIVIPQFQFIAHQLINEQFITPEEDNYLEKREEFTKKKKIHLYGIEFGFAAKKNIFKKLDIQATIGLGFNYINKRTERLAKGFTFNENFSFGFSYNFFKKSFLYVGGNFGHVSNLNFQKPNNGYNILGIEIGYSLIL